MTRRVRKLRIPLLLVILSYVLLVTVHSKFSFKRCHLEDEGVLRKNVNQSAVVMEHRLSERSLTQEFHGFIRLQYTLRYNCVFLCDMLVIEQQPFAHNVTWHLQHMYPVRHKLKKVMCDLHGCTHGDMECFAIAQKHSEF